MTAGTTLPLKGEKTGLSSVSVDEAPAFDPPATGDIVTLDVVLGPRTDWFTQRASIR